MSSAPARRTLAVALIAGLLLPLGGCISMTDNHTLREIRLVKGATTKADLLVQLGAPSRVRAQAPDETVLVFSHGQVNGTGYGVGTFAVAFVAQATHTGVDSLEVVLGPDRVVRDWRFVPALRRTPVWPGE